MVQKSEFRVKGDYVYDRSDPVLWILSHAWRHKLFLFIGLTGFLIYFITMSGSRIFIGEAADLIINPSSGSITRVSLKVLVLMVTSGVSALMASLSLETLANRLERDSRHELYVSLLGKSQTFHDQQRVGDIMARATDDMRQLNFTISPGVMFMSDMVLGFAVPMLFMAFINWQLLILPVLFTASYVFLVRRYIRRLDPVVMQQRVQHGVMNAGLEETISGIEIVKVAAQEDFERGKFRNNAGTYRDLFVKQGQIEAGYLPLLVFGIMVGLFFLHTLLLYNQGLLTIADIIAVMGLVGILRFPVFISLFSWSLLRMGVASAERIINLMRQETDIDENVSGHQAIVDGAIIFENVRFGYNDEHLILNDISFEVQAGQTVAIVGQTGSGKSTVTQLVARTYDTNEGRVLVDGVDVRDWNLDSLRSQIAKIEQDVFLFSRTIAENIAFGTPNARQEEVVQAAKAAQAHDFILSFQEGYETKIGERGATLSGGQRQRLALARAFLKNPRILILDDSTSAIDSATEDDIQKAMKRAKEGRTTLLITHRLSQIRWADMILVLEHGHIVAKGSHDDLLRTSAHYRRIFARYDVNLPELEASGD